MISAYVILLMVGATTAVSDIHLPTHPPPYVQSRELFDQAKYNVKNNLPIKQQDIHKPDERQQLGFSVLVGVIGDLVLAADRSDKYVPLHVVSKSVPVALRHYTNIASATQTIVSQLDLKTQVITDYIDAACGSRSVTDCNALVEAKINEHPNIYRKSADLLLSLGKVAKIIVENDNDVAETTKDHGEISYLLQYVNRPEFRSFIDELLAVYRKTKRLQFRRLLSNN